MQIFAAAIVTEVSKIYGSASSSSKEVLSCFFNDAAGSVWFGLKPVHAGHITLVFKSEK